MRYARVAAAVMTLSGCGRYQFAERDAGDGIDAPLGEFPAPQLVPALSDLSDDDDPTATADGLELYFMTGRDNATRGAEIYTSSRTSRSEPWGTPQPVAELNTTVEDQSPGVAPNGLTIYFSSRRTSPLGGTSSNIWMASRKTRTEAWSAPVFVAELSTTLDEFEPQPDDSGLRIVFYRQLDAINRDLYEATRAATADSWSAPVALLNVNLATTDERSPCLRDGGRELWFSSDRDSATANVHDIYRAMRTSTSEAFDAGTAMTVLSSPADDDDPWISSDGRILLLSSTRDGAQEIYEAQR